MNDINSLINEFEKALLSLDRITANSVLKKSYGDYSTTELIDEIVVPAMEMIGAGWGRGEIALSQVYMSGRICEELIDILLPPGSSGRKDQPKIALAVLEDYHFLGKRIVYSILRTGGFSLLDYGRVDADGLIDRAANDKVEILFISTLMFPSALQVKRVRTKLDDLKGNVKIVVGGAPFRFDNQLWKTVGAHAMGYNASDALSIIQDFMGGAL